MREQQNKTILVSAAAGVALMAGAYFGFISPQLEERATNLAKTETARLVTSEAITQVGVLREKEAKLPDAERQARELAEKFPSRYDETKWLESISRAAKMAGVTLNRVAPSAPANPDNGNVAVAPSVTGPNLPDAAGTVPDAVDPATEAVPVDNTYPIAVSVVQIDATAPTRQSAQAFIRSLEGLTRPILIDHVTYTGGKGATLSVKGTTFLARALTAPGAEVQ